MDPDSLQTLTGTKIRLQVIAITVGHRIGPENIQKYARLRTTFVVGVTIRDTLIHCAEVPDTSTHDRGPRLYQSTANAVSGDSARLQPKSGDCTILHTILYVQRIITTDYLQQPQDCSSLQTGDQQAE